MERSAIRDKPFTNRGAARITRPKTVAPSGLHRSRGFRLRFNFQCYASGSFACTALVVGCLGGFARTAVAQDRKPGTVLPIFEVDSHFPAMPDHMLLGGVGGTTADSHGNVWVFHRPHTLEEGNATENGYVPAPPVLEFSETGRYITGWGGPARGSAYEWFNRR